MGRTRKALGAGAIGTVVVALAVTAGVAIGGNGVPVDPMPFSDVGDEHPFEEEIEAIAAAGITTGYPDGTYRPGDGVSRQAMAAFMGRGFSRGGNQGGAILDLTDEYQELASITVEAGAAESGQGVVLLDATARVTLIPDGDCPCRVDIALADSEGPGGPAFTTIGETPDSTGTVSAILADQRELEIEAGATETYQVLARYVDDGTPDLQIYGNLEATYVPFGLQPYAPDAG